MDVLYQHQQEVTLKDDPAFRGLYEGFNRTPLGVRVLVTITAPGQCGWRKGSIRFFPVERIEAVGVMRGGAAVVRRVKDGRK